MTEAEFDDEYDMMMSSHTSMKVGGPAAVFCRPKNEEELIERIRTFYADGFPFILLGNGTNVIVRDGGYQGAVISTLSALRGIKLSPAFDTGADSGSGSTCIECGAGESLAQVCRFAARHGLAGMEALSGIPGTIGGAIYMNAGAYESDIASVTESVKVYDVCNDNIIMLTSEECGFSYRSSVFKTGLNNSNSLVILSVRLRLNHGNKEDIETKMADFTRRRNDRQPVEMPSAGSFFKRPEGDYAGRLIEQAGMKGARVGGAQVSEKHAGFIVNTGNATAEDVLLLADIIKSKVYESSKVKLEEEPIVIGVSM